tara:strand:- start:825 stop:1793 length:969 start_codon:yes stop_codon:yes gene_type:complete
MNKPIAIIAGEPNSISSEIIFKTWKFKERFNHKPLLIVGSFDLLNLQKKKLKYEIKLKKIDKNFNFSDLKGKELPIFDVKYNQKKAFQKITDRSNKYIFKCFDETLKFLKNKKIFGFINCPVYKETLFKNKHKGITEYLAQKSKKGGDEVMLIYNENLSVSPVTTHIPLKQVSKKITKVKIIKKVKILNNFYKKFIKKKPNFAILGLNPHNFSSSKKSEEEIISKAVKNLIKLKIKVTGPISADSSFMMLKKYNYDVIVGMYHDQVLTPFKALYKFNAINITIGLPFIRVSPDHGVAKNITGKRIASPDSLIQSIKFFNLIK